MSKSTLIIFGSSRGDGNTRKVVRFLEEQIDADFMDLSDYRFSEFDYDYKNADDDFIGLAERMTQYQNIVFATPIYWYAMSAVMKRFFDRLSDIVRYRKELGRAMADKQLFALACSSDQTEYEGFFMPFKNTAGYLNMKFGGSVHTWIENEKLPEEVKKRVVEFGKSIAPTF